MEAAVGQPTPQDRQQTVGQVVNFPTPQDRDSLTVRQLADAYAITYKGRDHAKLARVEWWCSKLGDTKVVDLDSDRIADLLDEFAAEPVQRFKGRDEDGNRVLTAHGPRKPATINRQKAALASLITYAHDQEVLAPEYREPPADD